MKSMIPCIPGFHHDDIWRNETGQPDYDDIKFKSEHVMGLVNGDVAPTSIAVGSHVLPSFNPLKEIAYGKWHPIVEEQIKNRILVEHQAPSGKLIEFNWQTMHRGVEAVKNGWRWFVRISRNTERQGMFKNEIRNQTQVYLPRPYGGW